MENKIIKDGIEFYEIPIFPKYFISKCGKVVSFRRDKVNGKYPNLYLNPTTGYYTFTVCLGSLDTKKYVSLHRCLALTFLPNPENKPTVNHINAIRHDCRLENLEWATWSENNKHAFVMGNQNPVRGNNSYAKPIIDLETGFVFDCIRDCADNFKIHYSNLRIALTHPTRYMAHKNRFKYI